MNLFCFSLEGSTDSLYEPVHSQDVIQEHGATPNRQGSPTLRRDRAKWGGSDPCITTELSQTHTTSLKKKKRRSHVPTSASDNETLDNTDNNHVSWQPSREKQDVVHNKDNHNKEMARGPCQVNVLAGEDRVEQLNSERREKDLSTQGVNFEAWNPNYERCDSHQQDLTGETEAEMAESKGTLRRIQRLVRVKSSISESNGHLADSVLREDSPVITCIGLGKKTEKKSTKAPAPSPRQQQKPKESIGGAGISDGLWSSGAHNHHWTPTAFSPHWDSSHHTCHRASAEPWVCVYDLSLPRATDWDRFESLVQELDSKQSELTPPHVIRSITDLDISESMRSSSMGGTDAFKYQSNLMRLDENGGTLSAEGEQVENGDQTKPGGIGKKMKAISLTMRKRMGRKYVKVLSEETSEGTERDEEGEVDGGRSHGKGPRRSSCSLESLYSLNSGQSSSSGVTSGSDGSSNRDSLRLEEELPYTGQLCGRAMVHTDFVPSPYDTESLKLKVGDVIDITSKPPMGIWTGMLNGKVGNFKFIYVDVLIEKEPEAPQKMRMQKRFKRPRPKTLQELLERLNLEEYSSSLLLNGYQTVDDLRELREQHLVELNVADREHRQRLLDAIECLQESQHDDQKESEVNQELKSPSENIKAEQKDCPRDSGCYIPSDCSDNSKEDTETTMPSVHTPPLVET